MFVPKFSPRTGLTSILLAIPTLALALGGCSRDELAPDCFEIDPDTGVCLIPDPGGTAPGINCATMPMGALRAEYNFTPLVGGGSGNFSGWAATGLPPGLSIDPNTGTISGVPTTPGVSDNVQISMFDAGKGQSFTAECGEIVVNEALNALAARDLPNHCLDYTASREDMLALLGGGDDTDITCRPLTASGPCPYGNGNGREPPGINFNAETCTHSGSIVGDRRGRWVWMVEVIQSGYSTRVPFCAANDVDTFHDITLTANGEVISDLTPGLFEYDPSDNLSFGGGTHQWAIDSPDCPGECNSFGFRFNIICSPFDPNNAPWTVTLAPSAGTPTGLTHELLATGPIPGPAFDDRPWVASLEMSYCTSASGGGCDTSDSDQFEQIAQTRYHYDVIGYPTLP
jgi:hypothetical protein